ncbi:MAG: biotin carboxyl carrier domain-containing protein, partial [Geminicoccaceae bacterium]|nr:biotin carboxyl carrier domain-containing protein [Geminicoccaceae bacterium]
PFVQEGETIAPGTVIGLVGVMKTFHQITSDVGGKLVRFLVENEEAIRPGQPIAIVSDEA